MTAATALKAAIGGLAIAAASFLVPAGASALEACATQPEVKVLYSGGGRLESVGVDRKGRIFFTDLDSGSLMRLRNDGRVRTLVTGIDGPGGIVFKRNSMLVGFGNGPQAIDGTLQPDGGLLKVNGRTGESETFVEGLQMANGIARGPGGVLFASNALGTGIDRVLGGEVTLNWASVTSPNGLAVSRDGAHLFASQTAVAGIQRIPLDDPGAVAPWFTPPVTDIAAGLDGLERGPDGSLYVAANLSGDVWRVNGPGDACELLSRSPFPAGPSDVAFTRGRGFADGTLLVTTWGGELLAIPGAA